MKKNIILSENQLVNLIEKIINEQAGGIIRAAGRFNLNKSPRNSSGRFGSPEVEDFFNVDEDCLLENWKRLEICFNTAKTYSVNNSDKIFANKLGPMMVKEMTGIGHGNILKLIEQIKTKGQLGAIVNFFDNNGNGESLYEWIKKEVLLDLDKVIDLLGGKGFDLPYCKKGCRCPIM